MTRADWTSRTESSQRLVQFLSKLTKKHDWPQGKMGPESQGRQRARDEDSFVGRLVEVPGVLSQGATLEDLEVNIKDAFELVLSESDSTSTAAKRPSTGLARIGASRLARPDARI